MSPALTPPDGFTVMRDAERLLIVDAGAAAGLVEAGLDRAAGWDAHLRRSGGAGRGATGRLELSGGRRVVLKAMRRGGVIGALWNDRYPGRRRLLDNLYVPCEARRRGIATPAPVGLLMLEGPPGLFRGWLAVEEIAGGLDLFACLDSDRPPTKAEIQEVAKTIRRMHDLGLDHRDLNLGNLLLQRDAGDSPVAYVIDLDRARLHDGPLDFRRRLRALRRLERSYAKAFDRAFANREWSRELFDRYADADATLAARLQQSRGVGRLRMLTHRFGWWLRGERLTPPN